METHICKRNVNTGWIQGINAFALVVCLLSTSTVSAASFEYSGDHGPGFWDETPGWEACGRTTEPGARQTPIDITKVVIDPSLRKLDLRTYPTEIALINKGYTIEQEYEGTGSTLFLDGIEYKLIQFHFHSLSEHAVRGERGEMELHAVFKWTDGVETKLAVVGVIYQLGKHNAFLQKLIDAGLPQKSGHTSHSPKLINLSDALTNTARYYTYEGSLTTPPCSEIVTWVVLKYHAHLSKRQLKAFGDIMGNNFRPIQERNGRTVRVTSGWPLKP